MCLVWKVTKRKYLNINNLDDKGYFLTMIYTYNKKNIITTIKREEISKENYFFHTHSSRIVLERC
jgi:hypothetical protein